MPRARAEQPRYRLRLYRNGWRIVWWDPDRGQTATRSLGVHDRESAQAELVAFLNELAKPKVSAEPTIAEVLDVYLATREGQVADHQRLLDAAKALRPKLGWLRVADLTPRHSRTYATQRREEGRGDGTIAKELGALRAALTVAVEERLIPSAPAVKLPRRPPPRDRWLTREEAERLLAACDAPHVALFVLLALHTAARPGAITALRWSQVDFEAGRIDFNEPGAARTGKGRAVVPINDTLRAALLAARETAMTQWVVEYRQDRVRSIRRGIAAACRRAGLEGVTPHTLRHTAATWLAQAGIEMWLISRYLGHTSTAVTERVYAKHHPDWLKGAAEALARKA